MSAGAAANRPVVVEIGHSVAIRHAGHILATSGLFEVLVYPLTAAGDASPLDHWLAEGKGAFSPDRGRDALLILVADDVPEHERIVAALLEGAGAGAVVTLTGSTPEMAVSDLLLSARSGAAWPTGEAGREPLYGIGHRLQYGIGYYLVIAALGALSAALADNRWASASVDADGVAFGFLDQHTAAAAYSGADYARNGTAGAHKHPSRIYGKGEGAVIIYCVREEEWFRLAEMTGLVAKPEFAHMQTEAQRLEHAAAIDTHIEAWLVGRSYTDIMALAREHRVPMAPARPPVQALELAKALLAPAERAAALGGWLRDDLPAPSAPADGGLHLSDLRRLRVVEMSTGWSMPLAGRILAALGAEVIKVESGTHFDSWRGSRVVNSGLHRYPDGLLPDDPINANAAFNVENVGKHSALLNLKHPRAEELALRLLASADLFLENHRPGALAARGLSRPAIRAVAREMGFLSISACGNGAGKDLVGWGPTIEAIGGMTALLGYADTHDLNTGYAIVDPLAGLQALAGLLLAMAGPDRAAVDLSMLQATLECLPEPFLDPRWNARLVNGHPDLSPHGIYRVAGADAWVALLCRDDAEWQRLVDVLGLGKHVDLTSFAGLDARLARRAELDNAIAAATQAWDGAELVAALVDAGVAAARVASGTDILGSAEAAQRGMASVVDHPNAGPRTQPHLPIRAGWTIPPRRSYAPRLGEDNRLVWTQLVGLSDAEYAALVADRAIY